MADRLAARTLELCRIPSPYGDEGRLADLMLKWASQHYDSRHIWRQGHSLVIGRPASDGRPTVALVGHLDTVPSHESAPPIGRCGDRIVARGASDMKSGLAVATALAEDPGRARLPCGLMLVLYEREEGPHQDSGLEQLLAPAGPLSALTDGIDLAIVMEPTNNVIQVGAVGSVHATLTFHGKSAHSARPWHGENAITRAGALLADLHGRRPVEVTIDGLVFREVMTITQAQGGRYRNVVPDVFTLNLNTRFAPGRTLSQAQAEIEALVAGRADITYTDLSPSGGVPRDNPLYEHLVASSGLAVEPKQAWTDVARLAEHGVPAVNLGPGLTAQAHQVAEYCEVGKLEACYRSLGRFLQSIGSAGRATAPCAPCAACK